MSRKHDEDDDDDTCDKCCESFFSGCRHCRILSELPAPQDALNASLNRRNVLIGLDQGKLASYLVTALEIRPQQLRETRRVVRLRFLWPAPSEHICMLVQLAVLP